MTKPLDLTKPVQTVSGLPARIICTDRKNLDGLNVLALVLLEEGGEAVHAYTKKGLHLLCEKSSWNLVNVPKRTSRFQNVYQDEAKRLSVGESLTIPPTSFKTYEGAIRGGSTESLGVLESVYVNGGIVDVIFHRSTIG